VHRSAHSDPFTMDSDLVCAINQHPAQ
jgi:hypothetical protein